MMTGWADPTQSTTAEVAKGPKRGFVWLWGDCSVVESNDGTKILEGSQQFSRTQGSRLRRCSHSACSNATAGTKRTRSRRSSSICQISWQFSCTKTKTPTTSNAWETSNTTTTFAIWCNLNSPGRRKTTKLLFYHPRRGPEAGEVQISELIQLHQAICLGRIWGVTCEGSGVEDVLGLWIYLDIFKLEKKQALVPKPYSR